MSRTNKFVFLIIKIVSWLIFVGLSIEAGGLIVNFIFSLFRPEVVHKLYQKLDLSHLYASSKPAYFSMYSFLLVIAVLKSVLFYLVIMLVTKMDLTKPFSQFVSKQISRISYLTFSIGILGYIAQQTAIGLQGRGYATDVLLPFWTDAEAFILMSAVVYVIATIFKKGLEIQTENDLTV